MTAKRVGASLSPADLRPPKGGSVSGAPSLTLRRLVLALSPYVCVCALQLLLLYPLHATLDLPEWDEPVYMGQGERFLHGGALGPASGSPVYYLLYAAAVKLFGTVGSIFFMQYFVKVGVAALLLLFLTRHTRSRPLALLLSLIWVVSGVNVWETVLVYHVALGFFLSAMVFLDRRPALTLILLCFAALTRLEYLFPSLAFAAYLIYAGLSRRSVKRAEAAAPKGGVTSARVAALLLSALLAYVLLNVSDFNPGTGRTWFAFNQNYARHEVEAGRFHLNPYVDSNVVIQHDFPGADSLTGAFRADPGLFSKHVLRNVAILPKAALSFIRPHTTSTFGLLYGALLGFAVAVLMQVDWNNRRLLFAGWLPVPRERGRILYMTLASVPALLPILLVYPLPHHTLVMVPFCLLWPGLACQLVLQLIHSPKFASRSLPILCALFMLSVLVAVKPYAPPGAGRPVYERVAQLTRLWPEGRLKLMGVGATWYASYLGSQRAIPAEPLATVYGGKVEGGSDDLRALLRRHDPDVVLLDDVLLDSENFDIASLEALDPEHWVRYPVGNVSFYFRREKLQR